MSWLLSFAHVLGASLDSGPGPAPGCEGVKQGETGRTGGVCQPWGPKSRTIFRSFFWAGPVWVSCILSAGHPFQLIQLRIGFSRYLDPWAVSTLGLASKSGANQNGLQCPFGFAPQDHPKRPPKRNHTQLVRVISLLRPKLYPAKWASHPYDFCIRMSKVPLKPNLPQP